MKIKRGNKSAEDRARARASNDGREGRTDGRGWTPIPDSIKSVYESDRGTWKRTRRGRVCVCFPSRRLLNLIKTVCRPKRRAWPGTKVNSLPLTENAISTYVRTRARALSSRVNMYIYIYIYIGPVVLMLLHRIIYSPSLLTVYARPFVYTNVCAQRDTARKGFRASFSLTYGEANGQRARVVLSDDRINSLFPSLFRLLLNNCSVFIYSVIFIDVRLLIA